MLHWVLPLIANMVSLPRKRYLSLHGLTLQCTSLHLWVMLSIRWQIKILLNSMQKLPPTNLLCLVWILIMDLHSVATRPQTLIGIRAQWYNLVMFNGSSLIPLNSRLTSYKPNSPSPTTLTLSHGQLHLLHWSAHSMLVCLWRSQYLLVRAWINGSIIAISFLLSLTKCMWLSIRTVTQRSTQ